MLSFTNTFLEFSMFSQVHKYLDINKITLCCQLHLWHLKFGVGKSQPNAERTVNVSEA